MHPLITLFFEIALFKKGPQDTPTSPWLLRLLLPIYIVVNLLLGMIGADWQTAVPQLLADLFLLCAFTWPLLYFSGKPNRFPQTLSALLGTDILISLFAIPVVASLQSPIGDAASLLMLSLMVWHWLVTGHIYRHALDRSLFFGLMLAFFYILIFSQLSVMLMPEPTSVSSSETL